MLQKVRVVDGLSGLECEVDVTVPITKESVAASLGCPVLEIAAETCAGNDMIIYAYNPQGLQCPSLAEKNYCKNGNIRSGVLNLISLFSQRHECATARVGKFDKVLGELGNLEAKWRPILALQRSTIVPGTLLSQIDRLVSAAAAEAKRLGELVAVAKTKLQDQRQHIESMPEKMKNMEVYDFPEYAEQNLSILAGIAQATESLDDKGYYTLTLLVQKLAELSTLADNNELLLKAQATSVDMLDLHKITAHLLASISKMYEKQGILESAFHGHNLDFPTGLLPLQLPPPYHTDALFAQYLQQFGKISTEICSPENPIDKKDRSELQNLQSRVEDLEQACTVLRENSVKDFKIKAHLMRLCAQEYFMARRSEFVNEGGQLRPAKIPSHLVDLGFQFLGELENKAVTRGFYRVTSVEIRGRLQGSPDQVVLLHLTQ